MKISKFNILQAAVWISIWSVLVFTVDDAHRTWTFNMLTTIKVIGFVVFFNLIYYGLLPLYFKGKRQLFYVLAVLTYFTYIGISISIDIGYHQYKKQQLPVEEQATYRMIPTRFMVIPAVVLGLVLFGAAATIRGFSALEKHKKAEEIANRRRLEAEIALMKSQINPHFLVNTINNLYAIALTEPEKTPDALLQLSEMLNYILHECASPKVSLVRDLEFVESYVSLQRLRLPPNVNLQLDLPDPAPEGLNIEPMILIPFIENAFKHGLTTKKPCSVAISIKTEGEQLQLEVVNALVPKEGQHGNPAGIGLANTRQRLEHSYPGNYQLDIQQDGILHRVKLKINLTR